MTTTVVRQTDLPGVSVRRGKVRDIYDLGDRLLIVATDRLSAFDCVLPDPIPHKGRVLTALSRFWFERFAGWCPNHLLSVVEDAVSPERPRGGAGRYDPISVVEDAVPPGFEPRERESLLVPFLEQLRGRAMLCRKAEVIPIECVARGFLAGSGWKEYQAQGTVCGIRLPAGLRQCSRLPEPIFTPSTKAQVGHDENISFEQACATVGRSIMVALRDRTLALYDQAADYARSRGILLADTKFEFGIVGGEVILIDEVLTPDSSRFWPADRYEEGRDQESFDKQYARNYLQRLCDEGRWDKTDPAPSLPPEVIGATSARYLEAYERITGQPLSV